MAVRGLAQDGRRLRDVRHHDVRRVARAADARHRFVCIQRVCHGIPVLRGDRGAYKQTCSQEDRAQRYYKHEATGSNKGSAIRFSTRLSDLHQDIHDSNGFSRITGYRLFIASRNRSILSTISPYASNPNTVLAASPSSFNLLRLRATP